jgi:predicted kinase
MAGKRLIQALIADVKRILEERAERRQRQYAFNLWSATLASRMRLRRVKDKKPGADYAASSAGRTQKSTPSH